MRYEFFNNTGFFLFYGLSAIFGPIMPVAFDRTGIWLRKCIFGYFFGTLGAWWIKNKQVSQTHLKILFSILQRFIFQLVHYFPYSQQLEVPRKIDFGRVPLKQHIGKNERKLMKTGPKIALDFFTHVHSLHFDSVSTLIAERFYRNVK